MDKQKVIEQLESMIEIVKDENVYITSVKKWECPDIEKVTAESDKGEQVVGLYEVGKNIDIDIDMEYMKHKEVE